MAKILKFKRGNTAKNNAYTGSAGELTVDTTKKTVVVHDGVTAGGSVLATDVTVSTHTSRVDNPHSVSKTQVGLGNVLNVDSTNPNNIVQDSTHRFVTDSDKTNWNGKINATEKAVANGVATLDVNGKVVLTQIPDSVLGQLEYMGTYSFSDGIPTATQKGQYWIASADGNGYITGDWAVWNGTSFDKVDNTDAVTSVAGRTGNVVLTKSDVGLSNVNNTDDITKPISTATQTALNLKANIANPTFTGIVNGSFSGPLTGNASTATTLATARTLAITGDLLWTSPAFNGSSNVTAVGTLATISDSGVGSFKKVTVDTKGRVTGTQTVVQTDITGILGAGSITNTMLANSEVTAGTYKSVTVDTKGIVTSGSNPTTVSGYGLTDVYTKTEVNSLIPTTLPASDVYAWAKVATKPTYTASEVGLGNVNNTSDLDKPISAVTQIALNTTVKLTEDQTIVGIKTFSSNIVGNITGNSGTATKLATARKINGVSFDGSANITIVDSTKLPLSGGKMTGAITAIRETKVAMAANNIDLATGNLFTKTISGDTTLTISNALADGNVNSFVLELTNGGSAVVTWFSGVKWAGGIAPTLTASGKDILGFYSHDGGTTWNILGVNKDVK